MIDYTPEDMGIEEHYKELTKIQRDYVNAKYKKERGENGSNDPKYRSVIFGKYTFQVGDDPFLLKRDWPLEEKLPVKQQK